VSKVKTMWMNNFDEENSDSRSMLCTRFKMSNLNTQNRFFYIILIIMSKTISKTAFLYIELFFVVRPRGSVRIKTCV